MKYTEERLKRIYELVAQGTYTQKQICEIVGITKKTWHEWRHERSDFSDLLKKAEAESYENLRRLAVSGLKKLLNGHQAEEWKTERKLIGKDEDGSSIYGMVETERRLKNYLPNAVSIIHVLNSLDSEHFKDRKNVDITTGGEKIQVFRIGDQEIEF